MHLVPFLCLRPIAPACGQIGTENVLLVTLHQHDPRIVKERQGIYRYPEPKILAGSNYCDVGFALDESTGRVVTLSAIDNLMKGAAGSAVQCMNLVCGFEETAGLTFPGLHPI